MLTVITPSSEQSLISLSDLKLQLGVTDRSEDDKLLVYSKQATAAVERYCNRRLLAETVEETFRLSVEKSRPLILSRSPVSSVTTVIEDGSELTDADFELDGCCLYRLTSDSRSSWSATKIVARYVAGYSLSEMPGEYQRAVVLTVNQYKIGSTRDPQVRSESTDGLGSTSYFDGLDEYGLAPEARGLLSRSPALA